MHDASLAPATSDRLSGSPRSIVRGLLAVVETVALTLLIFLGIQTLVAQPFNIQMTSMESTLLQGEFVLVDKLTPRWAPYSRGDIVVFDPPETWSSKVPFIKRVIGLPGDTVELRDGGVYVNGTELEESYLYADDGVPDVTMPIRGGTTSWTVPDHGLFVMGDHRSASADSRSFGTVAVSNVIGRAWLRYWPFDSFGPLSAPVYAKAP